MKKHPRRIESVICHAAAPQVVVKQYAQNLKGRIKALGHAPDQFDRTMMTATSVQRFGTRAKQCKWQNNETWSAGACRSRYLRQLVLNGRLDAVLGTAHDSDGLFDPRREKPLHILLGQHAGETR